MAKKKTMSIGRKIRRVVLSLLGICLLVGVLYMIPKLVKVSHLKKRQMHLLQPVQPVRLRILRRRLFMIPTTKSFVP